MYIIVQMTLYVNPENQKLLWNIINKHPKITEYFSSRSSENKTYWFQSCIGFIYENIKYENLTIEKLQHYNKESLKYMLSTVIKEPNNNNDLRNEIQYSRSTTEQSVQQNTQQNLSKSDLLNKNFTIRQKEYEDMFEKKVPDTIDFRDKIDDEPISNMDEILRTHLQMRENELKQYAPLPLVPENKTSKIIIDKNSMVNIEPHDSNSIIYELAETDVSNNEIIKSKKSVSWEDNEIEILKKQIRDLFEKMDKMREEIDVLKNTKDIINNEYKNMDNNNTNGSI